MKLTVLTVLMALILAPAAALAETIHLNDGTTLRGEILRFSGGKYEIRSKTLGKLSIDEYDIATIEYNDQDHSTKVGKHGTSPATTQTAGTNAQSASPAAGDIQQLQLNIAGNTQLMQSISGLQSDPQIQAILQDQEIMQAIMRYDLAALQDNPKFMRLMSNPSIKAITKQVSGQ